jgi:hypothetical protein
MTVSLAFTVALFWLVVAAIGILLALAQRDLRRLRRAQAELEGLNRAYAFMLTQMWVHLTVTRERGGALSRNCRCTDAGGTNGPADCR